MSTKKRRLVFSWRKISEAWNSGVSDSYNRTKLFLDRTKLFLDGSLANVSVLREAILLGIIEEYELKAMGLISPSDRDDITKTWYKLVGDVSPLELLRDCPYRRRCIINAIVLEPLLDEILEKAKKTCCEYRYV